MTKSKRIAIRADRKDAILERPRPAQRAIVIGAGLAGLSAAHELTQAGHDVTVLEATMRPGGRVRTLREPFSDGLHAEAGATRIPDAHHLTMHYAKAFDIELEPLPPKQPHVAYLRGKRIEITDGEPIHWPLELTAEERELGLSGMKRKYLGAALNEIGNATAPGWTPAPFAKYDQVTFAQFLHAHGASPDAIALLTLGLERLPESFSALMGLRDISLDMHTRQWFMVAGGNDRLPAAMASRLGDKIRYGSPVTRIDQDEEGVTVFFKQGGVRREMTADRVICTIPFSVMKHIEVSPSFTPAKRQAIQELHYVSIVRAYWQSRKKFWMDEGIAGLEMALSDLLISRVWNMSANQSGGRGIILSYIMGDQAKRIAAMPEEERVRSLLEAMERLHPGMQENCEGVTIKSWDEDEWARGGFALFRPGQMTSLLPQIANPEGRVHFAGEHTSVWGAWMQGALESGRRAAREIQEAELRNANIRCIRTRKAA